MFVPATLGSILDPTLSATYGPNVIPNLQGLGGPGQAGFGASARAANNVLDQAVQMVCACGIGGCDCNRAVSEINQNSALLNHLQRNFQTQALASLVTLLVGLLQNRGLLQSTGTPQQGTGAVEAAGSGSQDDGHSHAAASSGGASGAGPVQAVDRQGKKIGAQIAAQFDQMVAAAARDGVTLTIRSGLRTRAEQEKLYAAYQNGTGNLAAKPGTSNHESGEAIDFGNDSGAYEWLRKNAANFGFFNKIASEPWHYSLTGH